MEELWELRRYVEAGDVDAALALLDEMEEMSRDDKITCILFAPFYGDKQPKANIGASQIST